MKRLEKNCDFVVIVEGVLSFSTKSNINCEIILCAIALNMNYLKKNNYPLLKLGYRK